MIKAQSRTIRASLAVAPVMARGFHSDSSMHSHHVAAPREASATRSSPPPAHNPRPSRGSIAALAFVVLALLGVMAALVILGHRSREVRDEIIQVLEPTRNELYELQRLLALQEAEQRGGMPPPEIRGRLPQQSHIRAALDSAFTRMRPQVLEVGPAAVEAYAGLVAYVERWQARLREIAASPNSAPLASAARSDYVGVLRASDRLHQVLNRAVRVERERAHQVERVEALLVACMVMLAFAAILTMAWISRRLAALAAEARRFAAESEAERRAAELVSEEKGRFIRGITHDLKNPLGAVDAYAQLLQLGVKGPLSDEQRHYVNRIRNAVQQVLGTIQDLLELARAEVEGLQVERRSVDIRASVRETAEDYRAALASKDLSLEVDTAAEITGFRTDVRRVTEILGNLLSNALKYTPSGGRVCVRVAVRSDPRGHPREGVAIEVEDTGPGIPEEARERIFEEFHRLDRTNVDGSGLGLAISRRMARLIGGDLTVRDRSGGGSVFTLWLPLKGEDPRGSAAV